MAALMREEIAVEASGEARGGTTHAADLELVRRALEADARAEDELVARLGCVRRFASLVNRRCGRALAADELEDSVQETLFAVWRKLGTYEGRASLETWVYRFTYLELVGRVRRKLRGPARLEEVDVEVPGDPSALARSIEYERLYRSLDTLGPPSADVIRLKHLEALTFEEISERLGISTNTAKTRYYRGMKLLRQLYSTPDRVEDAPVKREGKA